jgi:hypothetical protein
VIALYSLALLVSAALIAVVLSRALFTVGFAVPALGGPSIGQVARIAKKALRIGKSAKRIAKAGPRTVQIDQSDVAAPPGGFAEFRAPLPRLIPQRHKLASAEPGVEGGRPDGAVPLGQRGEQRLRFGRCREALAPAAPRRQGHASRRLILIRSRPISWR